MLTVLDFHMASALRHGPFRLRRRLGRTTVALAEVVGSAMSDDEHLPGHRLEWRSQVRANRPWPDWQLAAAHRVQAGTAAAHGRSGTRAHATSWAARCP